MNNNTKFLIDNIDRTNYTTVGILTLHDYDAQQAKYKLITWQSILLTQLLVGLSNVNKYGIKISDYTAIYNQKPFKTKAYEIPLYNISTYSANDANIAKHTYTDIQTDNILIRTDNKELLTVSRRTYVCIIRVYVVVKQVNAAYLIYYNKQCKQTSRPELFDSKEKAETVRRKLNDSAVKVILQYIDPRFLG